MKIYLYRYVCAVHVYQHQHIRLMTPCEFAVQPWTLNKSMTGVIELRRDQNLTSLPKVITRNWSVWFVILEMACGPNIRSHISRGDNYILLFLWHCFCDVLIKANYLKKSWNGLFIFDESIKFQHIYITYKSFKELWR